MGDLISREAAIEYLMTNMGWHDEDGYEVDDADEKREAITDLVNGIPAVDAAPIRHGRWIEEPDRHYHYHCSECLTMQGVSSIRMNYCPECGALMEMHPLIAATANPGP